MSRLYLNRLLTEIRETKEDMTEINASSKYHVTTNPEEKSPGDDMDEFKEHVKIEEHLFSVTSTSDKEKQSYMSHLRKLIEKESDPEKVKAYLRYEL